MNADPAIEIDRVHVAYASGAGTRALRGISLTVYPGERLVVLGPSGGGKTTLLKLINRLVEPSHGSVCLHGVDTAAIDAVALRRRTGYVIQHVGLFPHFTVADNVGLPLRLLGWGRQRRRGRVRSLLSLVRLPPALAARYPRELSGGQQQRVGLARALAPDPEVLLMDEPFGALDPLTRSRVRADVLALLRRIRKTVVMVTHDVAEALAFGTRIALIRRGRLEQVGPPGRLRRAPASPFVREFMTHAPARGSSRAA